MVQVVSQESPYSEGFRKFAEGASEGYMNRADENAVRKSIESLGENPSAQDVLKAVIGARTYTPEAKQRAFQNYLGVQQFDELKRHAKQQEEIAQARNTIAQNAANQKANERGDRERDRLNKLDKKEAEKKDKETANKAEKEEKERLERARVQSIVGQLKIPDEQKQALGNSLSLSTAEGLLKEQLELGSSRFSQKVEDKNAEEYVKLTQEIPKLQSTLADIAYARELSDKLGVGSMLTSALGISPSAKEMESIGFTLMEPIVKIFNPSGPIAQDKLRRIQDKYTLKGTDAPWNRTAKLNALQRFAKQAMSRAQEKMDLIRQYEGKPAKDLESVLSNFDRESDTLSDAMLDYDLTGEEAQVEGVDPSEWKGETITGPNGEKLYSDGMRWIKR